MNDPTTHPRRYLFALIDAGGTVPAEVGAAQRLVDRGHDVVVLADDSMRADVEASGATFRPWVEAPNRPDRTPEHDPTRDWECSNPFQLFDRLLEQQLVGPAGRYATDVSSAIDELRPDLVVCSMFVVGGMVAAEASGVPFDVIFPNAYLVPTPGLPPQGIGLKPAKGAPGRLRDRAVGRLIGRLWNQGVPGINAVRASFGLAPIDRFFDQVHHARRHLVLTSADFDFTGRFGPNVRHVGAILDDPAWAGDTTWSPPAGDEPLVLVALSSSFQDQGDCLQRIVDALGTLPVRGIVTTGPALDPDTIAAPPNVSVVAAAPHSDVLRHAAVVVTHGGHGTVVRSLAAGVPMIVMHHGRDQADNAVRLTTRGAAVSVKRKASPAAIAKAVRRILDEPAYQQSAQRLGEAIRRDAASGALVAELEDLDPSEADSHLGQVPQKV